MITSTVGSRQSLGLDDLGLGPGWSDIVEALHNDDDVAEVEDNVAALAGVLVEVKELGSVAALLTNGLHFLAVAIQLASKNHKNEKS